jgi:D-cysteine desulfhydrase family pyridoxal phosphate-dependent enzyme
MTSVLHYPARIELGHLPTPLEEMPRLTKALGGPRLFIKRDDETGLATGGNKTRKLEFLLADALEGEADTVITAGAAQSNHCRQTAAAAAKCGLKCILTLTGSDPGSWNGNLLLDDLLGAEVRFVGDVTWTGLLDVMADVADEVRARGGRPYVIPVGGSNPVGATGYVAAIEELMAQLKERDLNSDHIVFASSSGGTQSGLVVGARAFGFKGQVLGISVASKAGDLMGVLEQLSNDTAQHLGLDLHFSHDAFELNDDYLGAGYGKPAKPEREAIRLLAQTEGILVDPVYTGRALAGLIDLIRKGTFDKDETVLFWHTGGTVALFAYVEELLGP